MAETTLALKTIVQGVEKANAQLNSFSNKIAGFSDQARKAGAAMTGFAVAGGLAITKLAGAFGTIEKMKVALKTSFQGSEEAANKAFETISKFSKETPFQLEEVTTGFLKLKNMGLDPSMEALTSYGNTASSMGKGLNDMVEAVADAATGEFERLKEFGIKAKNQGDTIAFTFQGVTTEVKNNSEEIQQYLLGIGDTNFAGGMLEQSQTLLGKLSSMKDELFLLAAAMGEPLKKPLEKLMEIITALSQKIQEFVANNPKLAEFAAIALLIATGVAAIGGPALLLIGFLPAIIAGFTTLTTIMTVISGPILAVTAGIAALYLAWQSNFMGIQQITQAVFIFIQEQFFAIRDAVLPVIQEIAMVAKETWDKIAADWTAFMEVYGEQVRAGVQLVTNIFKGGFDVIKLYFSFLWEAIKFIFDTSWKILSGTVLVALDLLRGDWESAWERIKGIFTGVWDSMKQYVENVINSIVGFIDNLISRITGAVNAVKGLIGLANTNVSAGSGAGVIKGKRAAGGPVTAGDAFLVGERGPEIFTPRIAGNITPNHKLGGAININISGVFGSDAGREIADLVVRELKFASAI